MVLGTRAGAHAMVIFWSWQAKEEAGNPPSKRKSPSKRKPVKVQAGSHGFPRARAAANAKREQARYDKVKSLREESLREESSWLLKMSDVTSAHIDDAKQAELDCAVQVELELFELAKVYADKKKWTERHAGRHRQLVKLAKGLRSRADKYMGFSEATKDAQFSKQRTTGRPNVSSAIRKSQYVYCH